MRYHQIINEGWTVLDTNVAHRGVYQMDLYKNYQSKGNVEIWARIYTVANKPSGEQLVFRGDESAVDFVAVKEQAVAWFNQVMAERGVR